MGRLIEVCVDNYKSAVAAIAGGANRLELCSSLADGGLTPTPGLLQQIRKFNSTIPIFCMLRCRPGNFIYSQDEFEVMVGDANVLQKYGATGYVFGALTTTGDVDMKLCRDMCLACYPQPLTFHRAFDLCKKPTIEMEVLIDIGFRRILTSGQQKNAQLGVKLIKKLIDKSQDRIIIMPGGGINRKNISFISQETGAKEFHGSFSKEKISEDENGAEQEDEDEKVLNERKIPVRVTDKDLVAEIHDILNSGE